MSIYSIALFLHISGVLGIAMALGLEWTGLREIQRARTDDQIRGWLAILKGVRSVGFVSMLTTVITGIYMMVTVWGSVGWVGVSLAALVLIIVLSLTFTGPRMTAIGRALLTAKPPVLDTIHNLASHPLLWISIQTRLAVVLGIMFLKTARPDWSGSLVSIGVAIIVGIASALPAVRREHAPAGSKAMS
jgi:hypothetical protein